jgi:hypothetical protein
MIPPKPLQYNILSFRAPIQIVLSRINNVLLKLQIRTSYNSKWTIAYSIKCNGGGEYGAKTVKRRKEKSESSLESAEPT